jgi:hypothetical protein
MDEKADEGGELKTNLKSSKKKRLSRMRRSIYSKQGNNIIQEVLSDSTMHGLPNVINSQSLVLKLMWLAFLIASIGFFTKFSYNSVANFLNYEVTTKIRRVYESPTVFPTISICNKNKFTTDFGIDTIKKIIEFFNTPNLFDKNVLNNLTQEDRYRHSDNTIVRAENAVTEYSIEDKKKLGHSIDDFLIECKFDDIFCNVTQDFIWYFDANFGNCYKYNSGYDSALRRKKIELKKSSQPGKYYLGLKLVLFESMPNILERISYGGVGFIIKIENDSYAVGGNSQVDLVSGLEANIAVERVYSSQLSYPYSDCHIDKTNAKIYHSELYDLFLNRSNDYQFKFKIKILKFFN